MICVYVFRRKFQAINPLCVLAAVAKHTMNHTYFYTYHISLNLLSYISFRGELGERQQ